eukprot:PhF_6_TR19410/c0_g1_i1/m.28395
MKAVGRVVFAPFNAIGNSIHRRAVIASKLSSPDLQGAIQEANSTGDDIAADATWNYLLNQYDLIPYRVEKLKSEVRCLMGEGSSLTSYTVKEWVLLFRYIVRCLFVFMGFTMIGRGSIYPPVTPDSPFVAELAHKYNEVL